MHWKRYKKPTSRFLGSPETGSSRVLVGGKGLPTDPVVRFRTLVGVAELQREFEQNEKARAGNHFERPKARLAPEVAPVDQRKPAAKLDALKEAFMRESKQGGLTYWQYVDLILPDAVCAYAYGEFPVETAAPVLLSDGSHEVEYTCRDCGRLSPMPTCYVCQTTAYNGPVDKPAGHAPIESVTASKPYQSTAPELVPLTKHIPAKPFRPPMRGV